MQPNGTITVSLSSHPEYLYFVDVRVNGRQLARRFNDKNELEEFVKEAEAKAKAAGITLIRQDDL